MMSEIMETKQENISLKPYLSNIKPAQRYTKELTTPSSSSNQLDLKTAGISPEIATIPANIPFENGSENHGYLPENE